MSDVMEKSKEENKVKSGDKETILAKKAFTIYQNNIHIVINKGDNVLKLKLNKDHLTNLKTENVI